jgi:hypothetical protein
MLKAAIKQSEAAEIRHRIIPADAVAAMGEKLEEWKDEIEEILKEEKEEKLVSRPIWTPGWRASVNLCWKAADLRCAKRIWNCAKDRTW